MEVGTPSRLNFPRTHSLFNVGPRPRDADVLLVFESPTAFMPGIASPDPEAKIAWIGTDPVLSKIKTVEFGANLWISATPANVARAVHDAATAMLDKPEMERIAARRERLEQQRHQLLANEEEQALEAAKAPTPTGRLVGYELGKLIDSDAIILNDGLSNGGAIDAYAKRSKPNTYYRSGSSAGGWGVGAAFGAKLAAPQADVIHASGDGFFAFGSPLEALWAEKYHKAPVLTIVFVNGSYSTGTSGLRSAYPEGYAVRTNNFMGGAFDPPPDFAKLGDAVGGFQGVPAVIAVRVPGPLQGVMGRGE
jgi:acetolactate synthase-1/2/3 large subunit